MQTTTQHAASPHADQIACLAYGLWERAGRPGGLDKDFWFEARHQLRSAENLAANSNGRRRSRSLPTESTTAREWDKRNEEMFFG